MQEPLADMEIELSYELRKSIEGLAKKKGLTLEEMCAQLLRSAAEREKVEKNEVHRILGDTDIDL